jgi:hypothetical protein
MLLKNSFSKVGCEKSASLARVATFELGDSVDAFISVYDALISAHGKQRCNFSSNWFLPKNRRSTNPTFSTLSALSGHFVHPAACPLSGVKRTSLIQVQMSAFDPKRTWEPP